MDNVRKLLYISEVPVELSYAGATLVYRLLEQYPPEQLLIIQTSSSINNRRIPGVRYIETRSKWGYYLKRLKLAQLANLFEVWSKQRLSLRTRRLIREFRPDAVVTVTFNLSWLTATKISRAYGIPLLLLLHDDFLSTENYGKAQSYLSVKFRDAYLHAKACFCIGPQMETYYERMYHKKGLVLYPSRGKNDTTYHIDWGRAVNKGSLNFCYAGSIGTLDFLPLMNEIAGMLGRRGHTLTLFASLPEQQRLEQYEHLGRPHVKFESLVHPDVLKKYMYDSVDVNILLNSFKDEDIFKLNFSSKIVDYTAVNLPVLFWGAPTSGILGWAQAGNYPCVVTKRDGGLVEKEIIALENIAYRQQLAETLQKMAKETFGFQQNYDLFIEQFN